MQHPTIVKFSNFFMLPSSINRRQLLRQATAITLGSAILPFIGRASLQNPPDHRAIYIPPGEGKKAKVGEMELCFKLNSEDTSGLLGSWESMIHPGELGAPPHYHSKTDEICRVLEGTVTIMVGDTITEVKAGGWHLRPKGVIHTFWNNSNSAAKTIDLCIPGGHEGYMHDLAALFENNKRPTRDDMKHLEEKHDIHYRYDLLNAIIEKYKVKL